MSEEMVKKFEEAKIDAAKGGPSVTQIHQVLDYANGVHDSLHAGFARVVRKEEDYENVLLSQNMSLLYADLSRQFPHAAIPADRQDQITRGTSIQVLLYQNGQVKKENLRNAWIATGQDQKVTAVPLVGDEPLFGHENSTVNLFQIMRQSDYVFTKEDYDTVRKHGPEIIRRVRIQGRVLPEWFQEFNLPCLPEGQRKDRSEANLDKIHACLLTSKNTVAYYQKRQEAADPANVAAAKALEKAKKCVDGFQKAEAVKAAKAVAAEALKALSIEEQIERKETARRQALHKKLVKLHAQANVFVTANIQVPAQLLQYVGRPPDLIDIILPVNIPKPSAVKRKAMADISNNKNNGPAGKKQK